MRYASLCSGVEAASLAWESLGWLPAWFAEIEPFPCAVLSHHWPHVPNHGDMTLLVGKILSGAIEAPDVLVGGTPCFTAGHLVLTEKGYKPIEHIRPDDLVVTHQGRLKPVVRVGRTVKTVGRMKAVGQPQGITCTPAQRQHQRRLHPWQHHRQAASQRRQRHGGDTGRHKLHPHCHRQARRIRRTTHPPPNPRRV